MLTFVWLPGHCLVLFDSPVATKVKLEDWFAASVFLKGNAVARKFLSACYLDIEEEKGK